MLCIVGLLIPSTSFPIVFQTTSRTIFSVAVPIWPTSWQPPSRRPPTRRSRRPTPPGPTQILFSKSLSNFTNSRNTSSAALHYLIAGSFWDPVCRIRNRITFFSEKGFLVFIVIMELTCKLSLITISSFTSLSCVTTVSAIVENQCVG